MVLSVRLSRREADLLDFVCQHWGLNQAQAVRMLVLAEAVKVQGGVGQDPGV